MGPSKSLTAACICTCWSLWRFFYALGKRSDDKADPSSSQALGNSSNPKGAPATLSLKTMAGYATQPPWQQRSSENSSQTPKTIYKFRPKISISISRTSCLLPGKVELVPLVFPPMDKPPARTFPCRPQSLASRWPAVTNPARPAAVTATLPGLVSLGILLLDMSPTKHHLVLPGRGSLFTLLWASPGPSQASHLEEKGDRIHACTHPAHTRARYTMTSSSKRATAVRLEA